MIWLTNPFSRKASPAAKNGSPARPTLEALEDRTVPSYLAAEFPGQGVWRYASTDGSWRQLTANNASQVVADSAGEVVAQFPGQGVWLCDAGYQWQQLTANNAASLAIAYTSDADFNFYSQPYQWVSVAADFPGQGLWYYIDYKGPISSNTPGWNQINGHDPSTFALDGHGQVVADFQGSGVWYYGSFTRGWKQLAAADAASLAIGGPEFVSAPPLFGTSSVAAAFPGYGVWRTRVGTQGQVGGWQQLTASDAATVGVNQNGDVVGEFPGWGVWSFLDSAAAVTAGWHAGWNQLTTADAALVGIDVGGNVYGQFPGWGVWYDPYNSWLCLTANNASSLGVGG